MMAAHLDTRSPKHVPMLDSDRWNRLPEPHQLALADAALREAVVTLAEQANTLADAIEAGVLRDQGGADALRLLVRLMHATSRETLLPAGHA